MDMLQLLFLACPSQRCVLIASANKRFQQVNADIIEMIFYHIIDETFRIYNKIDGLKTFFFGQRYDGRYSHVVSC